MHPSANTQGEPTSMNETDHDDNEHTPTERVPLWPGLAGNQSSRPLLARTSPPRLSNIPADADDRGNKTGLGNVSGGSEGTGNEAATSGQSMGLGDENTGKGIYHTASPQEEQLAKLRAVQAKVLLQQRIKGRTSSRSSPTLEDDSERPMPPSHAASFATITTTSSNLTSSTESTESGRTVRGSVPVTPFGNQPLRTPSYPFPYVPGTPRAWSAAFHQPFTALSPTIYQRPIDEQSTPGHSGTMPLSGGSTPAADNNVFMPPGNNAFQQGPEDLRFPTPNLYDLVLQLNSEPGLEPWWSTVANVMHEHFKAERVTLAMPADPTDIENVPWGQKATFSMNGPEVFVPHGTLQEQQTQLSEPVEFRLREPSTDAAFSDLRPQKLHPERLRPRLESRHSYAGAPIRDNKDMSSDVPIKPGARPLGPQRTVTHAPGMPGGTGPGRVRPQRFPTTSTMRHGSLTDPEFSSVAGGVDAGPYAEVFPTLRALDFEARPLIEVGGVSRVLERGRVVTVTRDYASSSNEPSFVGVESVPASNQPTPTTTQVFGNYRRVFASENAVETHRDYEEYEQQPTSPWAQSPAPSPAMQADEELNPFFASEEQQVEDSFNPAHTPKDYSQYNQVEAIGVDCASTVIHVPLVHPTLSQPMQSLGIKKGKGEPPQRSNTIDQERRAPIAILSVLSPTVPYPNNLIQSLKLLGPHLATSFAISQQFSAGQGQTLSIRHRRSASGRNVTAEPIYIEPTTLDDIVNAELEDPPSSLTGSMTSPSDYSGRSRHSPTSSTLGTPGWDPAAHGWTSSRSVAGTPAVTGTEIVDNYFDAKKRTGPRMSGGPSTQNTPAKAIKKTHSQETKPGGDSDGATPRLDRNSKSGTSMKEEKLPLRPHPAKEHGQFLPADLPISSQRPAIRSGSTQMQDIHGKRHSLLHSYGADFQSSFGTVLAATPSETRSAVAQGHERKSSYSEEMPPPSERLLRTIIDSLPVQIFTASPDTGKLTWVNSKFLIYRGQDSRTVLQEPWQAIHPQDRAEYMETWSRSLRTGQQLQLKVRLQRFDGSYRWFYVRAAPLKDKRQHIVHWIGTNMDFHEQHIAEMNLSKQQETAASEAKYRALANSSPQIVFAVNRTKGVTFCNSQWLNYSGQIEPQALGLGFMNNVHPDDLVKCRLPTFDEGSAQPTNVPTSLPTERARSKSMSASSSSGSSETERVTTSSDSNQSPVAGLSQRKLSELASTGILKVGRDTDGRPSYSTEVRLKHKDGDFRWHLVRVLLAEPVSGEDEETWYGTCTDINDHKTLERDLKATMDEKSRFLSNMSHEIRTPLNGITGMVNFLIDSSLTSEQMEHVNIIRASTEGLRGLINDILDLSKAEAGMIQLNMDWLYVRAVIEEVNDLTSAMAIDKGLELNYIVEENVPTQIKGDRFRIRQILLNVIGNAIKFTQSGEVFVRCSTQKDDKKELSKTEVFIKFEVIDTGSGFTDQEAEFLFKRFSQIDGSSTRQHGGTGLGLVISRQLAQLHGGDMSAKGSPGKGSTFCFYIKSSLPTDSDQPPAPPLTPGIPSIPILPMSPGPGQTAMLASKFSKIPPGSFHLEHQGKSSPKFALEHTGSPFSSPDLGRVSPAVSSAGSISSVISAVRTNSLKSESSSASSYSPDPSLSSAVSPMNLAMPPNAKMDGAGSLSSQKGSPSPGMTSYPRSRVSEPVLMTSPGGTTTTPPMFSILVVSPLKYSREATVQHIDNTLPKNVPHQITARESLFACQKMLGGEDPVIFSHVVVVLQDVSEIIALMDQVLSSSSHCATSIVLITDLAQRRKIMEQAPGHDYKKLDIDKRLLFIFKPLKPSRFGAIFDPRKERELTTDRNRDSAQQVAVTQKQVFEELAKRLGNQGKRVLLVEDNKVNQMVILKFFSKIAISVECANDGVQCTDKVFAKPYGFYSVILCDLHMPNKDGYQTCKEIRKWEKKNTFPHLPIIALSANVLGDVYQKCVDAGFNSYITKPVDFKELSTVLMTFMDPSDPSKPHELMKKRSRHKS